MLRFLVTSLEVTSVLKDSPHNFFLRITTYVTGILTMESGALVNLTISFDMQFAYWDSDMPYLTIYGSKGSLNVPDMNKFEGPVTVRRGDAPAEEVPVNSPYTENCRGLGLADMAHALQTGKAYRPSAELSLHVTEVKIGRASCRERVFRAV